MRPVAPPGFNAPPESGDSEQEESAPLDSPREEDVDDEDWFNEEGWEVGSVIHFLISTVFTLM